MTGSIRAFIALEVKNKETIENIIKLQEKLNAAAGSVRIKMVETENIHLTLRFLGDISESLAKKLYDFIEEKINSIYFNEGPLEFDVKNLGDFKGRTFYVDLIGETEKLVQINKIIEDEVTQKYGFKPDRKFKTHITIGRLKVDRYKGRNDRGKLQSQINQGNYKNLKDEYTDKILGKIVFDRVYLKKSTLTQKGPIYENLRY